MLLESDVMRLIVTSALPAAEAFERWVFEEVLPSIRKTGRYVAPAVTNSDKLEGWVQAMRLTPMAVRAAHALGLDQNAATISANELVTKVTGQNLLEAFGKTHLVAENQDALYFNPTELGARIKVSPRKFNELLASAGLQKKQGSTWEPTEAGKAYSRRLDTGKRYGSGVMIQQVKWASTVLDLLSGN